MLIVSMLLRICFALLLTFAAAQASDKQPGVVKAREAAQAPQKGHLNQAIRLYSEALDDRLLANHRKGIIYTNRGVLHARLGHVIAGVAGWCRDALFRPGIDHDGRPIRLYHARHEGLHTMEHPEEVHLDQPAPVVGLGP